MKNIVVVGAGHAGVQVADSLRQEGYGDRLTLIGAEKEIPYQRPPLSKDFLMGGIPEVLPLRGEKFYAEQQIDFRRGDAATEIDAKAREVMLASGSVVSYDELVLATGSSNRRLPLEGASGTGVLHDLRTAADARAIRRDMLAARSAIVVGAGFVGLEFAAAASKAGVAVTVLEAAGREMARVISPAMSDIFARKHAEMGIVLRFNDGAQRLARTASGDYEVHTTTGARLCADMVLCSIGATANTQLAASAGIAVSDGFVVDGRLATSVPHIWAIGDCVRFPSEHAGGMIRLEAVQNAVDQGRHLARVLTGANAPYNDVSWFWTIQGPWKLQIAGIYKTGDSVIAPGDEDKCSTFCFRDGQLSAVESLNKPADHVAARRVLGGTSRPNEGQVRSEGFSLKEFLKSVA